MTVTADERGDLGAVIRTRSGSAALARRARGLLPWSDGQRRVGIRAKPACNDAFVTRCNRASSLATATATTAQVLPTVAAFQGNLRSMPADLGQPASSLSLNVVDALLRILCRAARASA